MADRQVENWSGVPGFTQARSEFKLMLKKNKKNPRETDKQKTAKTKDR